MKKISSVHNTNLRKEIKIHQSLRHPNIIRFEGAVQVEHMVYIMLEYADNGALFFFINPRTGMPEKFAFKFFYQTALALEYLHSKGIMHRDIKPENILLDRNYDAKLCDFGWCTEHGAHLPDDESICGTYEYMPPEIVYEKSHNKEVDIWAIGVLLYELIHGRAPYTAESLDDIKDRMKQTEITFKKSLSPEAKDLLLKLLKFEPSERITLEQVFTHPFILKHLDEYENNKDSFKYIPPEPEWDNDLDIYLNGEMTNAVDEAKAALSAYDDRHRFEEELLSDPVKQQIYIKKQLDDNKINSNDVEKVFFLRDESGNLKMRLQMKDRPQPMRGNSEKKNSLARARGSEKFQRIVGPNSPPKMNEDIGLQAGSLDSTKNLVPGDKKPATSAAVPTTTGAFGSSLGHQTTEAQTKRKDPLNVHNPQSFQALHGVNTASEPSKQLAGPPKHDELGVQAISSKPRSGSELDPVNPARADLGALKLQTQPAVTPWDKPPLTSAQSTSSPIKSPYPLLQESPQQTKPAHSGPAPLLAPTLSVDATKAHDLSQPIRIVSSTSTGGLTATSGTLQPTQQPNETLTTQTSYQATSVLTPLKQQQLYQPDSLSIQQPNFGSTNKLPSSTGSTDKPDERRVLHPLSVNTDSPVKTPGPAPAMPTLKPNSYEPSPLNSQQTQAGQPSNQPTTSPGTAQILSSPSKQSFPYDQLGSKPAGSTLPLNPYNPALNTQDASRKESANNTSVNQVTNQPTPSERNPASPLLQHNRSTGNYTPTLKLVPQAEALKQVLEEPNASATKKPSAQSDLAILLGQKPNSWAKLEHGQLIYPPSYDPKNKSPQQTASAFQYPSSKPAGQTSDSVSPVKVQTPTDAAKPFGDLAQNKTVANTSTPGPSAPHARGAESTQASSTAYRPLTRSASRKEHTSNYTPPTSIPRLPTESNQSTFKAYDGNPLKQKMLTKPGPEMFLPSPELGSLKRNLISMGDRRFGMTLDETAHTNYRKDEFNNTFSYSNNTMIKTETKERASHEKLKGLSSTVGFQGTTTTFKPTGNQSLVQGSQSRYGLPESSKKPPILSQKTPASLQASKPDIRSALQETPQNKGGYTAKVFNNSSINSPREIMRNGASINEVINKNDLTAMQTDTSPTKKTNAQAITTMLTEAAPKSFEQMNSSTQLTDNRAGAIVIRSTPHQQESMGRTVQQTPSLSSQQSSNQTQVGRDRGLGHFESSATSLNHGLGNMAWSQSRPNLDQGSILKTLPSSTELGRPNTDSFHDRQTGYTAEMGFSGQSGGGITINSRKNSTKDNELTTKLRDMHGNELRHNTQSPLVYKQESLVKPAEVQTFGIYENRSILERSKSQSNPRRDALNNQLGNTSLKQTVIESVTTVPNLPERKSLTGLGEFRQVSGTYTTTVPLKAPGNPPLSTMPRSIQSSVKDFSKLNSGTEFGELNRSAGEAGSKTTMRYSQTHKYPRFEANGPISLEHKTLAEASNHNLGEKNLVSIYNPTTRYISSTTKEETQSPSFSSKPNENLAQQLGLKYDYSGSGPQKMQSFGQPTTTTKVFEKKQNDDLLSSPSSWNRASLPGKADVGNYPSQGYSPSQALNLSSPLINTKEYEGMKTLTSNFNPMKPATTTTVISSTSSTMMGVQSHGSTVAAPISIVGRTSSSSAGYGIITTTSSSNTTTTLSSNQGPIPIQTGTYKPQITMPISETRQFTVTFPGSSQTSVQPMGGGLGRGQPTTIYSKPREQFSPPTGKLIAN